MSLDFHNHELIRIINDNTQTLDFVSSVKKYIMNFYNMIGIIQLEGFHLNLAIDGKQVKNIFQSYSFEDGRNPEKVRESFGDIDIISRLDEFINIEIDLEYNGEFRTFHYMASDYFRFLLKNELGGKINYRSFEKEYFEFSKMYVFEECNGELRRGYVLGDTDLELIQFGDDWDPENFYFEVHFNEQLTPEVIEKLKAMTEEFHSYFTEGLDFKISNDSLLIHAYHIQNCFSLNEILTIHEKISLIDQYISKFSIGEKQLKISFTQFDNDWIELDFIDFEDKLQLFVLSIDGYAYNEFENSINSLESEELFDENDDFTESSEFDVGLDSERVGIVDFTDKNFVLTECLKEKSIAIEILNRGGAIKASTSKKVHYLIYGSDDTKKYLEALELQNKGFEIKLISEKTFLREFNISPKKKDSEIIVINKGNVSSSLLDLYVKQGELDMSIPKVHLEYFLGRENRHFIDLILQELADIGILQLSKGTITIEDIDKLREYAQVNSILSMVDEIAEY